MGRWRAGTAGLVLGVLSALGCVDDDTDPPGPEPEVEDPGPEAPELPEHLPGDAWWTVHTPLAGRQDVVAMAPDGSGGLVLLGVSEPPQAGTPTDPEGTALTLARHDGNGQQLWSRTFAPEPSHPGEGGADVDALLLAVSPGGASFVAGKVEGRFQLGESVLADGYFVAKLTPEGAPDWARPLGPVKALATDASGELLVAHGMKVERFDARGVALWSQEVPALTSASVAALDDEGGVVLAGQKPIAPFKSTGFIARLSPVGEVHWELEVGPDAPVFTEVAFRPDGSLLFTGDFNGTLHWGKEQLKTPCSPRGCYRTVYALAADASGEPLWGRVLDSEELSGSDGARLAVDEEGGAAVLWKHGCGSELARLSPRGEVDWQNLYVSTPCAANTLLRDVAFFPGGDLAGAGTFFGTRAFNGSPQPFTADDTDVFLQRLIP